MHYRRTVTFCLACLLYAASAHAAALLRATLPASHGFGKLEVEVDATAGVVRVIRGGREQALAIAIDRSRIDVAGSTVAIVPVAEERSVIHVRVPDVQRRDLAFEAVLSAQDEAPIFAGLTGLIHSNEGDRSGHRVLVKDRSAHTKFVIVAESREDTRICGQAETPLNVQGLDPTTMKLVGATLPRLERPTRDAATHIEAKPSESARPSLARVLVATGGSSPHAAALTDGNRDTVWREARSGDGHGEFATMRTPTELPIHAIRVTISPPQRTPRGTSPKSFYVATDEKLFVVAVSEDASLKPGQTYDVLFPEPIRTACVAIVLDEAYAHGAAPDVGIAEVEAVTAFDMEGATLLNVAKSLSTPRSDEAAALLRRAGTDGVTAVLTAYETLDARGRALAVDVASSAGTCEGTAADLLTRALADDDREVKKRALGRLERCGKAAGRALVIALRTEDEKRRAEVGKLLATVAPNLAIEPLGAQLGKGSAGTRRAIRAALARAAANATRESLLPLLAEPERADVAQLDLVRAMSARLPDLRPEADAAIARLLNRKPDALTRYLLAEPLAQLARAQGATSGELSRLADFVRRDPAWMVRARAVEVAAGIGPLAEVIVQAASDLEPRVRESALRALASAGTTFGAATAARALRKDEWTFVRLAAAEALRALPLDPLSAAALVSGLSDASPKVRGASLNALGHPEAIAEARHVTARLEDASEDPDVRAMAARTLGAMCVQSTIDRLTHFAKLSRVPASTADDRVGMAAIAALGALHPSDLEIRLAPLRAKGVRASVMGAAERALSDPGNCR